MAQDIINKNQDISYTNLDFSSIYTEIVDLAKQLSYRWDPSISDESDPGVVLLKLSALIADKMNYNIDKSVLEAFPLSVTQEGNARQLYEQLGYYMNWYESAIVPINLSWIGEDKNKDIVYTIPKFTMITDSETSRTYALLGTNIGSNIVISDGKLPKDGSTIQMIAMEGTPTTFSFLGETKITSQMIDENNRLYFETKYVSQNGIFIRNSGNDQDNYLEWKRVDNLYEQPYNDLRYKFGIDSKADVAYIEFPDNYAELIGSGIEIVYFIIDPEFTNIPAQTLDRFLVNIVPVEDTNITLSLDTVKISNTIPAYGHKNVETINEAYVNYKRTVGTFKTLITLRDYLNYILLEGKELCSNGFVTDRTNDPQLSYKIMSKVKGLDSLITEVESDEKYIFTDVKKFDPNKTYYERINNEWVITDRSEHEEEEDDSDDESETVYYTKETVDKLSPFSLKFYLLQDALAVNSKTNFNQTFNMITSENMPMISELINDTSHIEHTFEDILPLGENTYKRSKDTSRQPNKSYYIYDEELNKFNFISNSYYALTNDTTIYPYYTLEVTKVSSNFDPKKEYYSKIIEDDILRGYKREKITPTQGDYYTLKKTPLATGSFTEGTNYFTYNNGVFTLTDTSIPPIRADYYKYNSQYDYYYKVEIPSSGENINPSAKGWYSFYVIQDDLACPKYDGWYEIDIEALSPHIAYFRAKYPLYMNITTYSIIGNDIQSDIKNNILNALYEALNSTQIEFGDKIEIDYLTEIVLAADTRIKSVVFNNIDYYIEAVYYDKYTNRFISKPLPSKITLPTYSNYDELVAYDVCKDIYAKSVLAGVTTLLDEDTSFEYHLNQYHLYSSDIDDIYSITSEAIIDTGRLIDSINQEGNRTRNYTLKENETINLIRPKLKDLQSYQVGVHYEYLIYSDIKASKSYSLSKNEYIVFYTTILDANKQITGYKSVVYTNGAVIKPSFDLPEQDKISALSTYFQTQLIPDIMTKNEFYYEYTTNSQYWTSSILNNASIMNNVITGNDDITIQELSRITIVPEDGYKFYWKLNKEEKAESTGKKFYKLFDEFDSDNNKINNGAINNYTLKSGESLYYYDEVTMNLAILNAGTTITRNCGIYSNNRTKVPKSSLVSYTLFNDSFMSVADPENNYVKSPVLSGLYEANTYIPIQDLQEFLPGVIYYEKPDESVEFYNRTGDTIPDPDGIGKIYYVIGTYKLTEDTTFNDKDYYVLTMNSMSEYYEDNDGVYSPSGSITYDVFKQISLSDEDLSSINPQEQSYYERVKYEGVTVEDTYNASNKESKAIARPRYKISKNNTVFSGVVLSEGLGEGFNTNNTKTYPMDIEITESDASLYSPASNSLFEVHLPTNDTPEAYYEFYIDSNGNEPVVFIEDGNKTENVYKSPYQEGWYEKIDNNDQPPYEPSYKMYAYKPEYGTPSLSTSSLPLDFVNPAEIFTQSGYNSVDGYYYRFSTYDPQYIKTISSNPYLVYNASSNDVHTKLFDACRRIKIQNPSSSINIDNVDKLWSSYTSSAKPSEFYTQAFQTDANGEYKFVTINDFEKASYQALLESNLDFYVGYLPISGQNTNGFFYNSTGNSLDDIFTESPETTFKMSDSYNKINDLPNDINYLDTWYRGARISGATSNSSFLLRLPLFLVPNFYRFKYLMKSDFNNYYELKSYINISAGIIDPWECDSLSSDELVNNPAGVLENFWKPLQDNCSVTITENDVFSLTEGDTISIIANSSTNNDYINWPEFSNTETILNLDNYDVSYVHGGNEVTILEGMAIPNSDWRAYSNLLLNTSKGFGQILADNHTLTCFNRNGDQILAVPDDILTDINESSGDIIFQLKHPVDNKTGNNISVVTYDDIGNEIPNNIYIFTRILNNDSFAYSTSTNESTITVSSGSPVSIPFKMPVSDYLISITGPNYFSNSSYSVSISDNYTENPYPLTDFATGVHTITNDKTYYMYIPKELLQRLNDLEDNQIKLIFDTTSNAPINIVLGDLFKYEPSITLSQAGVFDDVLEKLKRLDKDNIYNYTFQPDKNDLISNPIDPKMFFDKNHIYNKYTIAQLDLSSADNIDYRFITSK